MYDAVDSLERASDPGEFVMVALERGKWHLDVIEAYEQQAVAS